MSETMTDYNLVTMTQIMQAEGVVALKLSNPRQPGTYESYICIHKLDHNEYHPFAVHRLIVIDDHPSGVTKTSYQGGDYCETYEEALERFNHRS